MSSQGPAVAASTSAELKRGQIVEAARTVLARDGLAGCTARAVADASPLTKSAIHYYFRDIDEIIDLAVAAHLDALLSTLRGIAAEHRDPVERIRAVLQAYLDTFADKPYAAVLWFEYWIAANRRGATGSVEQMLSAVQSLLDELLAGLPTNDTFRGSRKLVSWLIGTVVQQHVRSLTAAEIRAEIDEVVRPLTIQPVD